VLDEHDEVEVLDEHDEVEVLHELHVPDDRL
jgi:hypothetical protein